MTFAAASAVGPRPAQPATLGRVTRYLLLAAGLAAAFQGLGVAWGILLLTGDRSDTLATWAGFTDLAAAALVITSAVTAAVYLAWLHRTVGQAQRLGLGRPPTSPLMAVVWWFIPIAFLFMPYRIVADLHRRFKPTGQPGTHSPGIWWTAWLSGIALGRVAGALPVNSSDDAMMWLVVSLTSSIALALAAAYAALIVWTISQAEVRLMPITEESDVPAGPQPVAEFQSTAMTEPAQAQWKVCPDCAEQLRAAARVCRFCRHEFEGS